MSTAGLKMSLVVVRMSLLLERLWLLLDPMTLLLDSMVLSVDSERLLLELEGREHEGRAKKRHRPFTITTLVGSYTTVNAKRKPHTVAVLPGTSKTLVSR